MLAKHLTDDEVQLYVEDMTQCDMNIVEHIHLCEECKMKVDIYRVVIAGIRQQPSPSFDFDLPALVLERLPVPKSKTMNDKSVAWVLIFICVGIIGLGFYFFRSYLENLFAGAATIFAGVATIFVYLIAISAITVIAIVFFDMYKNHKKEMKILDLY